MQIFSMGIVFMLLSSPFKNLASINSSVYLSFCRLPLFPARLLRSLSHSVRPVRTRVIITEGPLDAPNAEGRVPSMQPSYARAGLVEMSVDGTVADGYWGLAGVRDEGTGTWPF